jgi:ABC-type glycerol-3-phosphate transport system substrate-binding protein
LAICLIAALCLVMMAGCGGKSGDTDKGGGSTTASPGGSGTNPSAAPQQDTYVYTAEYVPIQGDVGFLSSLTYCDGRLLTSTYGVIGDNTPEGVTPEYEGQYAVYGNIFYWINLDGTTEKMDKYEPIQYETDVENATVTSFSMGFDAAPDGTLRNLEEVFVSWYDGPEDEDVEMYSDEWYSKGYYAYQHNEEHFFLRTLGKDGAEIGRIDLSALEEGSSGGMGGFGMSSFTADEAGNIYMSTGSSVIVLDPQGQKKGEVTIGGGGFAWISNLIRLRDGRVAASFNAGSGDRLNVIDLASMQFSKTESYPVVNATNMSIGGEKSEYDFYYTNGSNFMGYSLEKGISEKVLNWINADVDPSSISTAVLLPDGRIATVETTWSSDFTSSNTELVLLSKVPAASLAQKTVLTLATQSLDYNIRSQIVKFNRNSPDFRIEVADYSEYNTESDASAGLTKLNTEILAGNVPDIMDLSGLNANQLGARGLLADLYPLLHGDSELNGHVFDSALRALESDGKLYRTAASFNLYAVTGAASVVGDTPGWTLKEFEAALKTMPEGCKPFAESITRSTILNACLNMEMANLIDWNTGECHFDSQTFTDILEFAAMFPATYESEGGFGFGFGFGGNNGPTEEERIAAGQQMLSLSWLTSFDSFQTYNNMFGGDATYIGFPTSQGVGNALWFQDSGYAISAKCAYKDAAWQFLRLLFSKDYQSTVTSFGGFPTNRDLFMEKLTDAMTPEYMKDENGNYLLDENGQRIEQPRNSGFGFGFGFGGGAEIYALTQEQGDEVMALMEGTDRVWNSDTAILDTITAESEAFFAGQKSAQEVAKLIQSKLTIYVNEQR